MFTVHIKKLAYSVAGNLLFEDFSTIIHPGARIGVIGPNGSGKSSLLKVLVGQVLPDEGSVQRSPDLVLASVPQTVLEHQDLSGGERFQKALTDALLQNPDLLLLDEPSNHLDRHNRVALMRMLDQFHGSIVVVTHDPELLRTCVDSLWEVKNGQIQVFNTDYDSYLREQKIHYEQIQQELKQLEKERQSSHQKLMREQVRASTSKAKGKKSVRQRKWPTVVSHAKMDKASLTFGKKRAALRERREDLERRRGELDVPEIIRPTFDLKALARLNGPIATVRGGQVWRGEKLVLQEVTLTIAAGERIVLRGANGSGKSSLIQAMLGCSGLVRKGSWEMPGVAQMGYLDQHYATLDPGQTVFQTLCDAMQQASVECVRLHLSHYLFRTHSEVNKEVAQLSGGEKARLSLAIIGAKSPALLILDEVTNNLDREAKEHVIQVLRQYPGALLLVSHEEDFIHQVGVDTSYVIHDGYLTRRPAEARA